MKNLNAKPAGKKAVEIHDFSWMHNVEIGGLRTWFTEQPDCGQQHAWEGQAE